MLYRLLGKLFFYFWIRPIIVDVIKTGATIALKMAVYGEKETLQKTKNRTRPRSDYRDHPPLT